MHSCSLRSLAWGGKSYAHNIEVANADGVTIYYNYTYTNYKAELAVTYQGSSYRSTAYAGKVVIPTSVTYGGNTYPVTTIGSSAFYGCSGLTEVTIGNSVTTIGNGAFYDCSKLTTLYSFNLTPPRIYTNNTFNNNHYKNVYLFVPIVALGAYLAANVWKEFENLKPISTGIERISTAAEQIQSANGQIIVTGLTDGTAVAVYDLGGQQIGTVTSKGGQAAVSTGLTSGAVVVVKVGERSVKVTMK